MKDGTAQIGSLQLFTLGAGAITGVGWVVLLGDWIADAGPIGAATAFALGGVLIIPIALAYAAAARLLPNAGGETGFVGATLGREIGLAVGWLLLLAYLAVGAFEAVSVGWVLSAILPPTPSIPSPIVAIASGWIGVALIAAVNLGAAGGAMRLQDAATLLKLAVLAGFIICGLCNGSTQRLLPPFSPKAPLWGFVALMATTPFWFSGFNVAVQGVAFLKPETSANRITLGVLAPIGVGIAVYIGLVIAAAMILPRPELTRAALPASVAFGAAFGSPLLGRGALLAALLGLVSTWNAVTFAAIRLIRVLSVEGVLPGWLTHQGERNAAAVVLCAIVTAVAVPLGRGGVGPLVDAASLCTALTFMAVSVGIARARRKDKALLNRFVATAAVLASAILVALTLGAGLISSAVALIIALWLTVFAVMRMFRRAAKRR